MIKDIHSGLRSLTKRPGFSAIAILTLALGIGANTAIFTVFNAVLLRPLPYQNSDRLVIVSVNNDAGVLGNTGYTTFADWRDRSKSFEQMALVRSWGGTLTGNGDPQLADGLRVSSDYFKLLGVSPLLGRDFTGADDHPDTRFKLIISYALWQRHFASDPQILGKPITLSDQTFTVVGVMPSDFEDFVAANYYKPPDLWAPLGYEAKQPFACRTCQHLKAIARLKPGVTLPNAGAEMSTIMKVMAQEYPQDYGTPAIFVARLQDQFVGAVRPALYLLMAAVGVVLLITCANVANLLLARASQRTREIAIRAALGAGQLRIVRLLLIESLALSLLGAAAGLLLATWSVRLLVALSPVKMLHLQAVGMNGRVLGFTILVSVITGLLFGLIPAWQGAKPDLQRALKENAKAYGGLRQTFSRKLLVVAEMGLALVLLIGAGLLLRSFATVLEVTPGFQSRNLLTLSMQAAGTKYSKPEQVRNYYSTVLQRVATVPGVEAAGLVSNLPFGGNKDQSGLYIESKPLPNPADAPSAERYGISPDYLRAMGIPLIRGRAFNDQDAANAPLVALINQTAARRFWPNDDPIGQRIRLGSPDQDPSLTIVGVVGDVNHYGLETPPDLQAYVPQSQTSDSYLSLVTRTSIPPEALIKPVREAIHDVDPAQPTSDIATMNQLISSSIASRRFTLLLIAIFAAVALLLATIGMYSVVSLNVNSRTNEFGIRMAVGAQSRDVLRMVIRQGMVLVALGLGLGLTAALALTRLMQGLLFGVKATDPFTFLAITGLLSIAALVACYIPARRATKVDPLVALRYE